MLCDIPKFSTCRAAIAPLCMILVAATMFVPYDVQADECDAPLSAALKNTTTTIRSKSSLDDIRSFLETMSFKEFNDTYGIESSAYYGAIGGTGNFDQANYQRLQNTLKSGSSELRTKAAYDYVATSFVDQAAYDAWQSCKADNNGGFYCWIGAGSRADPEVKIAWRRDGAGPITITDSDVVGGSVSGVDLGTLMKPGATVDPGTRTVRVNRIKQQELTGFVNVRIPAPKGGAPASATCSIYLPKPIAAIFASTEVISQRIGGSKDPTNEAKLDFVNPVRFGSIKSENSAFVVQESGNYEAVSSASSTEIEGSPHPQKPYVALQLLTQGAANAAPSSLSVLS